MTTTAPKRAAREAHDSQANEWGARAGLVSRGLLWLVLALLAAEVGLGGNAKVDKQGALAALREQPLGGVLLVALAVGFAAHAVFRVLEAAVGRRDEKDERKRTVKRLGSFCRAVAYGSLAVSTVRFLMSDKGGQDNAKGPTAKLLGLPAGQWLVAAVGLTVVTIGLVQAVRAFRTDFTDKLTRVTPLIKGLGAVGLNGSAATERVHQSFTTSSPARIGAAVYRRLRWLIGSSTQPRMGACTRRIAPASPGAKAQEPCHRSSRPHCRDAQARRSIQ